jgi:hypothetical protein
MGMLEYLRYRCAPQEDQGCGKGKEEVAVGTKFSNSLLGENVLSKLEIDQNDKDSGNRFE